MSIRFNNGYKMNSDTENKSKDYSNFFHEA